MTKRIGLILVAVALAVCAPATVFAWDSYNSPGNIDIGADAGAGFGLASIYLAAYPYAEYMVTKFKISDTVPLDIGVEGRGHVAIGLGVGGGGLAAGVGGFGVVHLGFKGLDIGGFTPYLSKFELYWGLGIAFDLVNTLSSYGAFGLASIAGFHYWVNDNFAVGLGETYWAGYYDSTLGIRLRLGK